MPDFSNQTAVITGAGAGIGRAIAEALAHRGAAVVVNDADAGRAEEVVEAIRADGGRAEAFPGDAGDVGVVSELVERAAEAFGGVDLGIANAGLTRFRDFFEVDPETFREVVDVNLRGTFFLAQAAARRMRAQGRGGRMLLMSSNVGIKAYPGLALYGMTKAALVMLTRSLGLELAPHGIAVNAIAPGATRTARTLVDDPNYPQSWAPLIPDGRVAEPEDIADAALFLLSPQAAHITGHTLVVDGGWLQAGRYPET